MDEQLPNIVELWDPLVAEQTRARMPTIQADRVDKDQHLREVRGVYRAIGSVARFAHEANNDPKWFLNKFFHRLLPDQHQELDVNFRIFPAVPRSPLDGEFEEVTDVELDQRGDQTPRSLTQGTRSSGGGEDTSIEDGCGIPLEFSEDPEAGRFSEDT